MSENRTMQRAELIDFLAAVFKDVIGIERAALDSESELSLYGMNSINAAKFSFALSQKLGVEISPGAIVRNFSLAALARYLAEERNVAQLPARTEVASEPVPIATLDAAAGAPATQGKLDMIARIVAALKQRASASAAGGKPAATSRVPSNELKAPAERARPATRSVDFGFIFFSSQNPNASESRRKYDHVTSIARYADANGFKAVWIPERHFFEFGGIFPDPAVLLANLAATTSSIRLRSGSVILPLHHATAVTESWAMLDNLSDGRVDITFASGWNPNDFVSSRDTYATLRETWFERMSQVERLWRGEAVEFYNGKEELVPIKVYPRPLQEQVAIWMAITGNPQTFVDAGTRGYNILTMLNSKPIEELAENIARYRQARAEHGFDPETGTVSLMLHTYVHEDLAKVDACVNEHYFEYIKSGLKGHIQAMNPRPSAEEIDRIVEHSFHYQRTHSALFGDVAHCRALVEKLRRLGVNEIACLVDFGITAAQMHETLPYITQLKDLVNGVEPKPAAMIPQGVEPSPTTAVTRPEYAIVGLAGRYPGAKTLEGFWDNLLAKRNCIGEIGLDRYDWQAIWGDPKSEVGKTNIKHFGLLDDIYCFDARFFGISKREAELMDPHARLLLETTWQCIENAGYAPRALEHSRTGVFLSFYNAEYGQLLESLEIEKSSEPYVSTAVSGTIKANRISYLLGLRGPSETYDTACSSSCVALHRATQAIAAGDCDQAIVAGVSLVLTPGRVISLSKMGILNESGTCNPFSHPARKEIIGEGVGALLIKPLAQALAAKDYIYAVVSGSDVSHHGNSSGSLTMPSASALAELMETTYRKLDVPREAVCHIEGHGSGNDSDVVELMAYQQCFATLPPDRRVPVGSVKSNIGFGEASGGLAQLTKCALSLSQSIVPATLHFERTDPTFDLDASRLAIQTDNLQLPVGRTHYMSVLAYGLGGTNAHVVLRNHLPATVGARDGRGDKRIPLLFSASSDVALSAYLRDVHTHLSRPSVRRSYEQLCGSSSNALDAVSRTLIERERGAARRIGFVVDSYDEMLQQLERCAISSPLKGGNAADALDGSPVDQQLRRWLDGERVDWNALLGHEEHQRLALPPVPFAGEELRLRPKRRGAGQGELAQRISIRRTAEEVEVAVEVRADDYFLRDHIVDGVAIMPAVGYLAVLTQIARSAFALDACSIKNIAWLMPFALGTAASATMRFKFDRTGNFRVFKDDGDTLYCKGQLVLSTQPVSASFKARLNREALDPRTSLLDRPSYWAVMNGVESKQHHGESMRCLIALHRHGLGAVGVLELQTNAPLQPEIPAYDSALGATIGVAMLRKEPLGAAVPFSLENFHSLVPLPRSGTLYAVVERREGKLARYDISLEDRNGRVFVVFSGFFAKPFEALPRAAGAPPVAIQPAIAKPSAESAGGAIDHTLRSAPPRTQSLTEIFRETIAEFLKVATHEVPVDEGLETLGLDSIGVNELTLQLSQRLAVDLPATLMFEYSRITEMVEYVIDAFADELASPNETPRDATLAIATEGADAVCVEAALEPSVRRGFEPSVVGFANGEIAVIGIGGFFPGAADLDDFWSKIKAGHDLIGEMPMPRRDTVYRVFADELAPLGQLQGGFVDDAERFDAAFFGIAPEELSSMDPQQRLFLMASWQALENAGYHPLSLAGRNIGVYVGAIANEYGTLLAKADQTSKFIGTGNALSGIANRTSYFFDLHGPSQSIDSACCSSLYAIDRAVADLRSGLCESAIAGGVSYIATPIGFNSYAAMNYLAKDWRCKAFAQGGDGWSKGETFAAVYLKSLERALADGDAIYAVIKASGVNHGGRSHFYEQPNSTQHLELITSVYRRGRLDPRDLVHIEAHGTGTEMGDALEYNVLQRAVSTIAKERGLRVEAGSCAIGSIKSNIGHAEAAAGIAGFIKTVLLLDDRTIPATLHIAAPNRHIRLQGSPLYLANRSAGFGDRQRHGSSWHASVHSFNFSGAAAHVLVGEAPQVPADAAALGVTRFPLCLSAPSIAGLATYLRALLRELDRDPTVSLDRWVFTVNRSKSYLAHRLALFARSTSELRDRLAEALEAIDAGRLAGRECTLSDDVRYAHLDSPSARKERGDFALSDDSVAMLVERWLSDIRFDWGRVLASHKIAKLHLPSYSFVTGEVHFPQLGGDLPPERGPRKNVTPPREPKAQQAPAVAARAGVAVKRDVGARRPESAAADVEALVRSVIADLFTVPDADIDLDEQISAYPFDSLTLIRLADTLNARFGLHTTAPDYFAFVRLSELVDFIREQSPVAVGHAEEVPVLAAEPSSRSAHPRVAATDDSIAVIGMSGRLPGARDLDAFWTALAAGKDCIVEIPQDRWDWRAVANDPSRAANRGTIVRWGGFIDGVDEFDPLFFSISPREAQLMDPQQRLLMMYAWKVIEDAGYAPSSLAGSRTGIFIGTASSGYGDLVVATGMELDGYTSTGAVPSIGPNRMSFLLDLRGPSEPIETACSSSLVAVHRAVRSIQSGDCDAAIVGGINTMITPWAHISFGNAGMLCEDGRCKTFSKDANGYVRGEGVGMLFLKPLAHAERDGDHIYGLIRGSAENHGGRANSLTAPNPKAQAQLIKAAYLEARIDPRTVTYIETHGTGTPLGDPIEINGLKSAFGDLYRDPQLGEGALEGAHCGLGSVKTNIGHLELAAGVAGVIKVLLQLQHQTLVKSLHSEELNPYIQLQGSPFYLVRETQPWQAQRDHVGRALPRRAGVSSFGFGGVNAHVVIEEYVCAPAASTSASPALIVLSAKTAERLDDRVRELLAHLLDRRYTDADLADIAYTLQVGRDPMEQRLAFAVASVDELIEKLRAIVERGVDATAECYRGDVKQHRETASAINTDVDLQTAVSAWLAKSKHAKLLSWWVKGIDIDWQQLHADRAPRRVPLPTYPFARERHWIEPKHAGARSTRAASAVASADTLAFQETWQASGLGERRADTGSTTIAVVLSDTGHRAALLAAMREVASRAKLVFVADPADADAFRRIVSEHGSIAGVWHLRPLEDAACLRRPDVVVQLLQALRAAGVDRTTVLLAGEFHSALDRCHLESWIGCERSLQQVLPHVRFAVVQDDRTSASGEPALAHDAVSMSHWARRLHAEQNAAKVESALYSAGVRYVLRTQRIELPERATSALRKEGVYLITGGLGGLGHLFATHLAERYAARLLLVGRSALDADKQRRLDALQAHGARVLYVAADVTDATQISAAIERARAQFGPLNGVIHAAGLEGRGSVLDQSLDQFGAVLAPKVVGTLVLDELCRHEPLDFFCCFSSSSAMLGDLGSCDYAIANRFQLAFAKYARPSSVAICWPLWAQGGMGADDAAAIRLYLQASGQRALTADTGLDLFERIAGARSMTHALVMLGDAARIERMLDLHASTVGAGDVHEGPQASSLDAQLVHDLRMLASEVAKLPADVLDVDENLADFGFDSIGLTQLAKRVCERYRIEITAAVFFSRTSVRKVAEYLLAEQASALHAYFDPVAKAAPTVSAVIQVSDAAGSPCVGASIESSATIVVDEPIAIVGLSGQFPGASTLEAFWDVLQSGADCITEIPATRWDARRDFDPQKGRSGKSYSKWGGFLDNVERFDPLFFSIAPRNAELMDPQELLFLETTWNVLESCGHTRATLARNYRSNVGVYVGASYPHQPFVDADDSHAYAQLLNSHSAIANRVSHFFGLTGPSIAVDTMCSSAAMAIHLACQDLRRGSCDCAIAGGVSVSIHPRKYIGLCQTQVVGSHPASRSFASGDGFHPAEAVGAVLLMPLSRAVRNNERILAIIKSSATNHVGGANAYMAPNPDAQAQVIEAICRTAGVDARTVSYVEAAANGSELGDAIEAFALSQAFRTFTDERGFCALGSVKANIGHAEAASAMSQLAKVVLQLQHRTLAPTRIPTQLNPGLQLEKSPFYLQERCTPWNRPAIAAAEAQEIPRRAIVNSYGAGGTNVAILVEEFDDTPSGAPSTAAAQLAPCIIAVSAKNPERLRARLRDLGAYLDRNCDVALEDVAHTLLAHREVMDARWATVATTIGEVRARIDAHLDAVERGTRADAATIFCSDHYGPAEAALAAATSAAQIETLFRERRFAELALLWTQGAGIDWTEHVALDHRRVLPLPTYPFARVSIRTGASAPVASLVSQGQHATATLRHRLEVAFGIPAAALADTVTLRAIGINSIEAIRLRHELARDLSCDVPLHVFARHQTLGEVARALEQRCAVRASATTDEAPAFPVIQERPAERFEPFPLTDIQQAFWIGRRINPQVGALLYFEFEVPALDVYRLKTAWTRLVAHHDMLRTILVAEDRQQVLRSVRPYAIKVQDLRQSGEEQGARSLASTRARMLAQVFELERWPLFDIRVSVCSRFSVLHFAIDEFIVDGMGIELLLRQWQRLYDDPAAALPTLSLTFRDYVLAQRAFAHSPRYRRDLAYWAAKLARQSLRGPRIGRAQPGDGRHEHVRLTRTLPQARWDALKGHAESAGVSPTVLLLTVFSEVLRQGADDGAFALVLTYFNKPPIHPQIDELLGAFISTTLFIVEPSRERSLTQMLRDHEQQLWDDLEHSSVTGVRATRELKAQGKVTGSFALPVVFTSMLNNLDASTAAEPAGLFAKPRWTANQTPQVQLDHQVREQGGALVWTWDLALDASDLATVTAMFERYAARLIALSEGEEAWSPSGDAQGATSFGIDLVTEPKARYEPFALTDQQQAYVFGRGAHVAGGGSCHYYLEVDARDLDVARLEAAWLRVIGLHDMLRARIFANGTQQTMRDPPAFRIQVVDLRDRTGADLQAALQRIARTMNEPVCALGEWPYFALAVTRCSDSLSRVHVRIELLIADGKSIQLLLEQLWAFYVDPTVPIVPASCAFRDYVISLQRYRTTAEYRRDLAYWETKFAALPGGPTLPQAMASNAPHTHRELTARVTNWAAAIEAARRHGLTSRAVLLTAYMTVVSAWNAHRPFSVVVPCWDRLALHPQIESVVGDFTALCWVVSGNAERGLVEQARDYQRALACDLAHQGASGLTALRKALGSRRPTPLSFPVVFTDVQPATAAEALPEGFEIVSSVSRTPQVSLDCISAEASDTLDFHWDAKPGAYAPTVVAAMFASYRRILEWLADHPEHWDCVPLATLIDATPHEHEQRTAALPARSFNIQIEDIRVSQ